MLDIPLQNQNFKALFSNGVKFNVPKFQRDYAWDLEQWEELWEDILGLDKEEDYHYMGYIVLQQKSQDEFVIIDGQQRLVTLSIMILALMGKIQSLIDNKIDVLENKERLKLINNRYIGTISAVTLNVSNKLNLNRNNKRHFRELSTNLTSLRESRITKTNSLLNDAFDFFSEKINFQEIKELAELLEKVGNQLIFTKIIAEDNINAYKIFETLNARGMQLSNADLLKNYIFTVLDSDELLSNEQLNILDEDWAVIISQLGINDFSNFIRCHHNMQKELIPKHLLYNSIKKIANSPKAANEYFKSLKKYVSIYTDLVEGREEFCKRYGNSASDIKHYLDCFKLFDIKTPYSLLMSISLGKFSDEEFTLTLKYIYELSIRYNVICKLSPKEQDKKYNKIAIKIFNGEFKRASHIKNSEEFKNLYPSDKTFISAFTSFSLPSRRFSKQIRFLLAEIENILGRKTNFMYTNLEHICPYNVTKEWAEHFNNGDEVYQIYDKIANMVLLEKDDLKRASFIDKKKYYKESGFELAKKVSKYDEWDSFQFSAHQSWLAEQAVKTWRVDYE